MKKFIGAALLGATLMAGSMAQAAVTGVTGQVLQIATPDSVTNVAPTNNTAMLVFNEVQNLVLGANLNLGSITLLAGTRINSHMVLLNREGGGPRLDLTGTVSFDGVILGLVTQTARLLGTDAILGAPGTSYTNFNQRGLEGNEGISFAGDTLSATLRVTQPGDWIRVVTVAAVPVPAAGFLLVGALGGLAALRRRRARAA